MLSDLDLIAQEAGTGKQLEHMTRNRVTSQAKRRPPSRLILRSTFNALDGELAGLDDLQGETATDDAPAIPARPAASRTLLLPEASAKPARPVSLAPQAVAAAQRIADAAADKAPAPAPRPAKPPPPAAKPKPAVVAPKPKPVLVLDGPGATRHEMHCGSHARSHGRVRHGWTASAAGHDQGQRREAR